MRIGSIRKMKDGRTHLAYKAEHVVDLESDLVLAAEIRHADEGDTQTMVDSVMQAQVNVETAGSEATPRQAAADKGYHAAATLELADSLNLRTYVPEPEHPQQRRWTDKPPEYQRAVINNRRRVKRDKGRLLQRKRSELCERSFAHVCDSGGARRTWLRGIANVAKRHLIAVAAHNLGRILRKLTAVGKPKAMQAKLAIASLLQMPSISNYSLMRPRKTYQNGMAALQRRLDRPHQMRPLPWRNTISSTAC